MKSRLTPASVYFPRGQRSVHHSIDNINTWTETSWIKPHPLISMKEYKLSTPNSQFHFKLCLTTTPQYFFKL